MEKGHRPNRVLIMLYYYIQRVKYIFDTERLDLDN